MDKTEEYVEKCRAAHEVQRMWKPQGGDYYYDPAPHNYRTSGVYMIKTTATGFGKVSGKGAKRIWLPRQEDAQEIALAKQTAEHTILHYLNYFNLFVEEHGEGHETLEQLSLAYAMAFRYKKFWDGSKWAKQEIYHRMMSE